MAMTERFRRSLLLCLALLAVAASGARAAGPSVGVGGGWVVPSADFGDVARSGWHLTGSLDVPLASRLSLGLAGAYSPLKTTDTFLVTSGAEPGTFDAGTVRLWWAGARGDLLLTEGETVPFLRAGLGAYGLKTKVTTLFFGDMEGSETKAGVQVGVGIHFRPDLAAAFEFGAAYHLIFGGDTRFIELTALWRFGGSE